MDCGENDLPFMLKDSGWLRVLDGVSRTKCKALSVRMLTDVIGVFSMDLAVKLKGKLELGGTNLF